VRRVPIPPELVRLLREHVESYGTGPDGRLFWTYRGGIYQPSTVAGAAEGQSDGVPSCRGGLAAGP
jgi:hypothetical protein